MSVSTRERVWTVLEVLKWSEGFLKAKGLPEPRTEAELLLMAVLGIERVQLYVQFDRPLSSKERELYREYILRRARGEPVQYIAGFTYFLGLKFFVDKRVLIPRFDTEILAETVIKAIRSAPKGEYILIDVGTGSGCLAISLAKYLDKKVYALDISEEALVVAKKNAEYHQVSDKITFIHSDLLEGLIHEDLSANIVLVANPPYISPQEYELLDKEVRNYEPKLALYAEENGLEYFRKIIEQAAFLGDHLKGVFFEIGAKQGQAVSFILERYHQPIHIIKDLGGNDRVVYTVAWG